MFGYYKQIVYLCTVFKINTAPKILKKRELGKFMNLKSYNRSPVRRLEEEVEYLTLRIIKAWEWQGGKTAIFLEMFNHEGAVVKVAPSIKKKSS